jgi:hypothetical protein
MSKKLIAVASAAALALSVLVAMPAAALAPTVTITGTTGGGTGTSTSNAVIRVPDANSAVSGTNALTFVVAELETGDVVRITSTGSVKVIDTAANVPASSIYDITNAHKSSIEKTRATDLDYTFYAQSTSTTAGTVVVSVTRTGLTSTTTHYVKGAVGLKYKITDVTGVPTTMAKFATSAVTFKITDYFGNAVESLSGENVSANLSTPTWDSSAKVFKTTLTAASSDPFTVEIDLGAADVAGFADTTDDYISVVNFAGNASLATQVASLITDYNALAKKWNKRVASRTAPKKKVALK